jgi:predicted small lipoprotein YifL
MRARLRVALLTALLGAAAAGCGQQGPLALPDEARPIERIDPTATEQTDDERQDER